MPALTGLVFHIADARNWPGIQRDGLLCATDLMRRALGGSHGQVASRCYRPKAVTLPDGVVLRDQAPMPPGALAPCLDPGRTTSDWYGLINAGIYFWTDPGRVARHGKALGAWPQVLVTLDANRLLAAYGDSAFVTPFNAGAARRRPARRGARTFVSHAAWATTGWMAEALPGHAPRKPGHPPAELVIRRPMPDIMELVLDARPLREI